MQRNVHRVMCNSGDKQYGTLLNIWLATLSFVHYEYVNIYVMYWIDFSRGDRVTLIKSICEKNPLSRYV